MKINRILFIALLCCVGLSALPVMAKAKSTPKDSFSVYIFMLDECKITQYYTPLLNELNKKYGNDNIEFVGLFPNFSSKKQNIEKFRVEHKIEYELKTDYFKSKSINFDVSVTPEVVVYNENTKKVIYKGRIDNAYYSVGRRRRVVTKNELSDVLEKIVKNQHIDYLETEAIGCFINFKDNLSKQ